MKLAAYKRSSRIEAIDHVQLGQLAQVANVSQSAVASSERVVELLDAQDESPDAVPPVALPAVKVKSIEQVTSATSPVLPIEQLSPVAKPGQTVAIVGPTGAGKTTLVNLMLRFYELQGGAILIDGVDIARVPRAELRARLGMVLQDTWLFGDRCRENIRYGRPNARDEEVTAAAKATYVDRFVVPLPMGYDTVIDEEAANASAARSSSSPSPAHLADPSILILDGGHFVGRHTHGGSWCSKPWRRCAQTVLASSSRTACRLSAMQIRSVIDGGKIVGARLARQLLRQQGAFLRFIRRNLRTRRLNSSAARPKPDGLGL